MILSRLAGRDNRHATGRCVDPGSRQSSMLFGSCLRITSRHRGMAIDAGFSLVEVMLSLTLAILLLGAIYAAIGQSWRITASGREEITRSQVARAVIRIMTTDVRSVMFVASGVVEDEANDSEDTSSAETTTSVVTVCVYGRDTVPLSFSGNAALRSSDDEDESGGDCCSP